MQYDRVRLLRKQPIPKSSVLVRVHRAGFRDRARAVKKIKNIFNRYAVVGDRAVWEIDAESDRVDAMLAEQRGRNITAAFGGDEDVHKRVSNS